jgi:hypothetical protein
MPRLGAGDFAERHVQFGYWRQCVDASVYLALARGAWPAATDRVRWDGS